MATVTPFNGPRPGSDEALAAGCTCPVVDNNRGRYAPFPADEPPDTGREGWWITFGCPIHAPATPSLPVPGSRA